MRELTTLADFLTHVGEPPPPHADLLVQRMAVSTPHRTDFEPFRHHIYALSLYTEVRPAPHAQGASLPPAPLLYCKMPYQLMTPQTKPWCVKGYYVAFSEQFLTQHKALALLLTELPFLRLHQARPLSIEPADAAALVSSYEQLYAEYHAGHPDRFALLAAYLHVLLAQIHRLYKRLAATLPELAATGGQSDLVITGQYQLLLAAFTQDAEENPRQRTVAFYADHLAIHPHHLNAAVKRATGHTAQQLLQAYITRFAQNLLLHTDLSVKEISHQLAFKASSHFVTFFKKHTGQSPTQFRLPAPPGIL